MQELSLSFSFEPVVKGRPRVTRWGTYNPKKTEEFKKAFIPMLKAAWTGDALTGPLDVKIRFVCKRPKKPAQVYPRGDLDNYEKAVWDCANEILWLDDSQIVSSRATKEYGNEGEIHIRVRMLQLPLAFE